MSDATCRALRLIQMMRLLADRWYTSAELAERLRASPRSIQRDVLAIQGDPLYAPVVKNGSRYRMQSRRQE